MNPTPNMTLREFVERFYIVERPVGKSATNQLRDMVRVLSAFAGRELTLSDLDENLASRWIAWLERIYAAETCRSKQRALLCVWRYAADLDAATEPRKRRIRKVRKASPFHYAWTIEEIEKLLASIPTTMDPANWIGRNPRFTPAWWEAVVTQQYRGINPAKFWVAFVRTAFDSGLRVGDVLSIRREWIDAEGILVVQQQKTGNPIVCRLSPETVEAIAATFPPDRELLFPWAANWRQKFHVRFRELVKAAGIRPGTTKYLRRSRASYAERDTPGMARRVLGHTSADTWKRYVDVRIGTAPPPLAPKLSPERFAPPKRIEGPRLLLEGPKNDVA